MEWTTLLNGRTLERERATGGSDLRNVFENDYQRIILSASFRRLQDKTQVFPLEKNDFIRTRLTHSLEVSTIAKSMGTMVGTQIVRDKIDPKFTVENIRELSDLLASAGLLHDIGNPPFGHFGETAIRQWFAKELPILTLDKISINTILEKQMCEDFLNFEGNAQVLRVVTKLHQLFENSYGMNLTSATLNSFIKYPVNSLQIDKSHIKSKKMGYFYAEKDIFQKITEQTETLGNRHPVTFLLEAADDISYLIADLEDAVKKGILSIDNLIEILQAEITPQDYLFKECFEKLLETRKTCMKEISTFQAWSTTKVRGKLINSVVENFFDNYSAIMAGTFDKALLETSKARGLAKGLEKACFTQIFTDKKIIASELAGKKIIYGLLDLFVPAAIYYDSGIEDPNKDESKRLIKLISDNHLSSYHRNAKNKNEMEKLYLRLLLITDFICGMTDTYAKDLYQQLNGIY
ncbi:deoxyguanosinetriphosphate triphosphohydrolase [Listeria monocytogenes]|nr:deoxyguanosinetriphosphate triphosphohydrolase [Listeria monocytogenes]EAE7067346.1 deoxyguanosinetriphosphate triphosphohydrolase [Listeria monocytogenes]EAG6980853.1 deoxyguanosinetriphosphate triphosphohydrolase [Listeria monocytogenes]EAQ2700394.1 deoxyguanosinetriphosphate triphosphohydrolase [Listeria monocytogenes]EBF5106391.1 deoxyguanosinetriphosphate triphosphohydrolase [Listeria monocytogenes]